MYDFTNVTLNDEESVFVLPQADCLFVTRALASAGIPFACYGWSDIGDGCAPVGCEEVERLAERNPACAYDGAQCAIVSRVPEQDMLAASAGVHGGPIDPEVAEYRKALAARGDRIPDASCFSSMEELGFCAREVMAIYRGEIIALLEQAGNGDEVRFSGSLDPCMYEGAGHRVTFAGLLTDPVTRAMCEYESSQICIVLHVDEAEEPPFYLVDAWPDVDVSIAEPTGRDLLGELLETDAYREASPLKRAYLERTVLAGHDHPMEFVDGDGDWTSEAIVLYSPRIVNGVTCCAVLNANNEGLSFVGPDGQCVDSPYAGLPGRADLPDARPGFELLDDVAVFQAFARDYPETAEVLADLKERMERHWREQADRVGNAMIEALATGDFSGAAVDENAFFPTDAGLYLPKRGEVGVFLGYDDPEAAPYLEQLRETGWKGETWVITDKPWYKARFDSAGE